MMLNRITKTMLCAERVWRAPVAKHEENVALTFMNFGLERKREREKKGHVFQIESSLYSPNQQ